MNVIIFGATGMVGQGVLRECLLDDGIDEVVAIGRSPTGLHHPKLRELLREDLFDFGGVAVDLQGYNACFFCLGVSSAGLYQADYTRLTFGSLRGFRAWASDPTVDWFVCTNPLNLQRSLNGLEIATVGL